MTTLMEVAVPVAPLWRSPDAPRDTEAPVLADRPDHAAWLAAMDAAPEGGGDRFGLFGRIEAEAVRGEPVLVHDEHDGWARVSLPWQPSTKGEAGYPGYLRSAHLRPRTGGTDAPDPVIEPGVGSMIEDARGRIGLAYLWGGTSAAALDCSGLVLLTYRRLGVVVPRDAGDQATHAQPVPLGTEDAGDLYFFAHPGHPPHHVGIVTRRGVMLHAPATGSAVVEEPLSSERRSTLVSAGRIARG